MKIEYRFFLVVVPTADGESIADEIPVKVPMIWDEEAQDFVLTPEAHEIIEAVKARHMGLLTPDQLRELRAQLGNLSQKAMGELLQVGEKSWCRWESGKQRPSRSVNVLLRALYDGELSVEYLEGLRKPARIWSAEDLMMSHQSVERDFIRMDETLVFEGMFWELEGSSQRAPEESLAEAA